MRKFGMVGVCLTVSMLLTACGAFAEDSIRPGVQAQMPDMETVPLQEATQTLSEFHSIEIDVMAADVQVVSGEQWSISYHLSEKEPVKRFGVTDGTLYLETAFDAKKYFKQNQDWFVTVTVPAAAALSEVNLETISGNVQVKGITCDDASLSSTSGDVAAETVIAKEVEAETVSGDITADAVYSDSLKAETVSGGMNVDGSFAEIEMETVSGNTEVSGSITKQGAFNSVSGDVALSLNSPAAIYAGSLGGITLNGEKERNPLRLDEGAPIRIQSVSGKISIQTGM